MSIQDREGETFMDIEPSGFIDGGRRRRNIFTGLIALSPLSGVLVRPEDEIQNMMSQQAADHEAVDALIGRIDEITDLE